MTSIDRNSAVSHIPHKARKACVVLLGSSLWIGLPLYGWLMFGWPGVEKVLTKFAMPVGLIWSIMLFCGMVAVYRNRADLAKLSFAFALLIGLAGNSWISGRLNSLVERPVRHLVELPDANYDAIVLLGGSTRIGTTGVPVLNWDGQRLLLAAQMYHAGKTGQIIATGGKPAFSEEVHPAHGEQGRQLLESIGVPPGSILCLGGRNTREEMTAIRSWMDSPDGLGREGRIGMITTSTHMPRAIRLAENAGLDLDPIPCLFVGQRPNFHLTGLVPTSSGLTGMSNAAYELLARAVGQ